jgi:hypothetical protein
MFFKRSVWQIFSFKNCFTPPPVAFQSRPDAKNRPALKGFSANQIASFSLKKNNNGLLTEREVCTVKYQTEVF